MALHKAPLSCASPFRHLGPLPLAMLTHRSAGDEKQRKPTQCLNDSSALVTGGRASARTPHKTRRRPPEKKSAMPLIALQLMGQARWTPRNYASLARNGVMQNAVVYRCVRMI